jgi:hypothetical protein
MSDQEAESRGLQWCAAHGWGCRLVALRRIGTVVRLEYDAQSSTVRGPLAIELGAINREVLDVSLPVEAPPPPALAATPSAAPAPQAAAPPGITAPAPTAPAMIAPAGGPPGAPPPGAPIRPLMDEADAKRLTYDWCRQQGLTCDWASADLDGTRWKSHARVIGNNAGDIYLQWDAEQWTLLKAEVAVFPRP